MFSLFRQRLPRSSYHCSEETWAREFGPVLEARGIEARKAHRAVDADEDGREALDTLWTARFRFPYDAFVRNELGRLHREAGDFITAESIYREAIAEFPRNAACRTGLAQALAEYGNTSESESIYRQAMRDVPDAPFVCTGLSKLLFDRSARNRNLMERNEAKSLLEKAAAMGSSYAQTIVNSFDERWEKLAGELVPQTRHPTASVAPLNGEDMRPAQRLGRALLLQWQAERRTGQRERERLFTRAEQLLNLPIAAAGECRWAFIEASGFLLLARDRVPEARAYFEARIAEAAPRRPLGLRLGLIETRARLGEPLSEEEDAELQSFGALGAILPLVLKVVRLLDVDGSDAALRAALLELYPRVQQLIGMPASEIGEDIFEVDQPEQVVPRHETPDIMLAQWLSTNVLIPAGVHAREDLESDEVLSRARIAGHSNRASAASSMEKLALAEPGSRFAALLSVSG